MSATAAPLTLHADRLLPSEPGVRALARNLSGSTRSSRPTDM